ncbi:hypothetical protein CIW48_19280 [Methylobacterium sp. P1-11]|nr:hypothetical protein CIW48_19280 [Methylobacterium sp. P1-11]
MCLRSPFNGEISASEAQGSPASASAFAFRTASRLFSQFSAKAMHPVRAPTHPATALATMIHSGIFQLHRSVRTPMLRPRGPGVYRMLRPALVALLFGGR